jgi:hypothetical protein
MKIKIKFFKIILFVLFIFISFNIYSKENNKVILNLLLGTEFDNNIILLPNGIPEPVTGKGGLKSISYLKGGYKFFQKNPYEFQTSYSFYKTYNLNKDLEAYNTDNHNLNLQFSRKERKWTASFGYEV